MGAEAGGTGWGRTGARAQEADTGWLKKSRGWSTGRCHRLERDTGGKHVDVICSNYLAYSLRKCSRHKDC